MIPKKQDNKDEAFQVLARHDWDALEAICAVLAERDTRLRIATIAMGRGFTNGWRP
jgi:hypothetical protein